MGVSGFRSQAVSLLCCALVIHHSSESPLDKPAEGYRCCQCFYLAVNGRDEHGCFRETGLQSRLANLRIVLPRSGIWISSTSRSYSPIHRDIIAKLNVRTYVAPLTQSRMVSTSHHDRRFPEDPF
ncbi:hypothetical protein C8Q73DRAFT_92092 [Cubamyces lactineus]|nr:hypothetical protein C8Q73DRAFT_92092 [Cubamyces lactineus]